MRRLARRRECEERRADGMCRVTNLEPLRAFSTLERATYSPICSLTRSWVRVRVRVRVRARARARRSFCSLMRSFLRSMILRLPDGVYSPTSPVQK